MRLEIYKTLWGHEGTVAQAAEQARAAEFQGVEGPVPAEAGARREFARGLREEGLGYIAEISATGFANPAPGSTVAAQLECFERLLGWSLEAGPVICTTMAGSDLWSFAESVEFLTRAHELAVRSGARVGFETHRSRSLFHPITTRDLLRELPEELELTIDFSHWCVVTERLVLEELPEVLALCARRVLHVHGRVGYDQGAQVPDPRAPEYGRELAAHLAWWRALWAGQRERGVERVTMTPEFGPDGYLHLEPYTRKPAGDLNEINAWMGRRLREEFAVWLEG